ncbi:MAG TPA: fibronectin type III domain-containing protein [Mycobacteriales bacterium]|jgi:hypothetical protein|nr:fibronectin type III domain-containing protein [Mycobacteriales bacterium]
MIRAVTALGLIAGTTLAATALAPSASATPSPARVDLVSSMLLGPDTQSTSYQDLAEPGDAVQNVYYVSSACTPRAGEASCDAPNGSGQGVSVDGGGPISNTALSVSVDHGFFTPNCVSGGINVYGDCTFAVAPAVGGEVGNLSNLGSTESVTTDASGEFTVTLAIGRDTTFDNDGSVLADVTVAGLSPDEPGDVPSNEPCDAGATLIFPPTLDNSTDPDLVPGCPVETDWTTQEQPLNGGEARLVGVPAFPTTTGGLIPTENNVDVSDTGTVNVPDVDRAVFDVRLTDQFGNLTSDASGNDLPALTKSGPASLYQCQTDTSDTSACTSGTAVGASTPTGGEYLDTFVRYQADTSNSNLNLRVPCGAGEASCSATNTTTPGVNDGLQTDTLGWAAPRTTFNVNIAGVWTYTATEATKATDTYQLNFYNQLNAPVVTFSATPDPTAGSVNAGSPDALSAKVTDSHGAPVVNQTVSFAPSGSNASSCTSPATVPTDSTGTAAYDLTCAAPGSASVLATVTSDPGNTQLATKTWTVTVVTPPGAPSAPTNVAGVGSNGQATVQWTAPSTVGSSPIIGYNVEVSSNGGSTWIAGPTSALVSTATTAVVSGLSNGTSYTFRVAAINIAGTGPFSVPSAPVTIQTGSGAGGTPTPTPTPTPSVTPTPTPTQTVTSTPTPTPSTTSSASPTHVTLGGARNRVIDGGSSAKIGTTMSASDDTASVRPDRAVVADDNVQGAQIDLLSRAGRSGAWNLLRTLTTDAAGSVATRVQPKVNTEYRWRFLGNQIFSPAISPVQVIYVRQVVTASLTSHRTAAGGSVQIYGTVAPNEAGQQVVLQRLRQGRWVDTPATATIHRQKLPSGGVELGYVVSVPTVDHGTFRYRVSRPETKDNFSGTSGELTLHVT